MVGNGRTFTRQREQRATLHCRAMIDSAVDLGPILEAFIAPGRRLTRFAQRAGHSET